MFSGRGGLRVWSPVGWDRHGDAQGEKQSGDTKKK